jgi:hypothetical protein
MGIGRVSLTQENLAQGGFKAVERKVLYIGTPSANHNNQQLHSINTETDLDQLLGAGESLLKTQLTAARQNADSNWVAYCWPIKAEDDWQSALMTALEQPHDCDCESIALCKPIDSKEEIIAAQALMADAQNRLAKFLTLHLAIAGPSTEQSWPQYLSQVKSLQSGLVADRVALVPLIYPNALGALMGRLSKHGVSLADTPMRVATGALVSVGGIPEDAEGAPLTMAIIQELADNRFSVPQWYTGFDGLYWADHPLLDKEGGDFQVYEYRRVLDYLSRRIRILMLNKIANRELNNSPASISYHQSYFMRPLKEAAQSSTLNNRPIPGMIQPPEDGDIVIQWKNANTVNLYMQAAPVRCPKKINAFLSLDINR